jgi:hypothetical protein
MTTIPETCSTNTTSDALACIEEMLSKNNANNKQTNKQTNKQQSSYQSVKFGKGSQNPVERQGKNECPSNTNQATNIMVG